MAEVKTESEPWWCVVANVRPEAYGRGTSTGMRHFRAGALLWVYPGRWGDSWDRIHAIGHHRTSKQLIDVLIDSAKLTNWRAKGAYKPAVIAKLREGGMRWNDRPHCEAAARSFNTLFPPVPDLRGEIARRGQALHLLDRDPRGLELERLAAAALGRWTERERQHDRVPPIEVFVLSDWLEDRGLPIPIDELVRTLDRRRQF